MSDQVRTHGAQFLTRSAGADRRVLNQEIAVEVATAGVRIGIRGNKGGVHMPVASDDPAVVEHYRQLDRAQMVVDMAERPSIEPNRVPVPVGRVPAGYRTCWLCEGRQRAEDHLGNWQDCANCGGEGVVPAGYAGA